VITGSSSKLVVVTPRLYIFKLVASRNNCCKLETACNSYCKLYTGFFCDKKLLCLTYVTEFMYM